MFMSAKATLFDKNCNPLLELGIGPHNTIRGNPKGKSPCLAGFDNLPGDAIFRDYIGSEQLSAPRLRVGNGIQIFHSNRSLYFKKILDQLHQAVWKPESPSKIGNV